MESGRGTPPQKQTWELSTNVENMFLPLRHLPETAQVKFFFFLH